MKTAKTSTKMPSTWIAGSSQIDHLFQIVPLLKKMPVNEVSDVLAMVDNTLLQQLLAEFDREAQVLIFLNFELEKQLSYFQAITKKQFSALFENMSSQQRSNWFQILTEQEQIDLLPFVVQRTGEKLISWSYYKSKKSCKKEPAL